MHTISVFRSYMSLVLISSSDALKPNSVACIEVTNDVSSLARLKMTVIFLIAIYICLF